MAASAGAAAASDSARGGLDVSFTHGFIASLSVIIVSELGDKTFFIAAILSMQHSRLTVFLGAVGALFTMTVLSGEVAGGRMLEKTCKKRKQWNKRGSCIFCATLGQ